MSWQNMHVAVIILQTIIQHIDTIQIVIHQNAMYY